MQFDFTFTEAGKISFFRRLDAYTSNYLYFYIDSTRKGSWRGEYDWSSVEYDVSAGSHTFKWVFDKNYTTTGGTSNTAWIDFVVIDN